MTTDERWKSLLHRSVVVLNAGCMPGDLADDELDIAEAAILAAEQNPTEENKEALKENFSELFHSNYERRVRLVNEPLSSRGRLVIPTYIQNGIIRDFEAIATQWRSSKDADRPSIEQRLLAAVGAAVTLPHYRAMHVYQAMRVPKSAPIAHYIEKATQHFYAQDYFSAMLVLLPAVEKLILFHIRHLTDDVVTTGEMRARIASSTSSTEPRLQTRYRLYKEYVLGFITRFQQMAKATSSSSGSNIFRNKIYHVAEDDPFYTYDECVTLFCFFDAYVQMLALEDDCELYGFVPDNQEIRDRVCGYWATIFDNYIGGEVLGNTQMVTTGTYFREEADRNYMSLLEPGVETKRMMLHALLILGSQKVADYANSLGSMPHADRAATLATGISDFSTFHELGMKLQQP